MSKPNTLADDLSGLNQLSREGFLGVTAIAESLHQNILSVGGFLNKNQQTSGLTGFVYRSVRFVANTGFQSADWAIRQVSPLLPEVAENQRRMRWLSMLNGVLGDHLVDSGNPLALSMVMVNVQQECTLQQAVEQWSDTSKNPLLMVHGLCLNEQCWQAPGRHGEMLAGLGHHAPLYLRYNSGLAINENGRQLSERLNHICAQMPFGQGIDMLAHSMGGLVVRSALHAAQQAGHLWPARVDKLIFLGTPHNGAYLEKTGALTQYLLNISPYSRPFVNLTGRRSQGIQDLNTGRINTGDRIFALPKHIKTYAIAGLLQKKQKHLAGQLLGDGLVSVASALGHHRKKSRQLNLDKEHQFELPGVSHMGLLSNHQVQEIIISLLS